MRKVTKEVIGALLAGKAKKVGNTHTDGTSLFLHGNCIARVDNEGLHITTAGWNTATTRERLRGLPNVRLAMIQGRMYLDGTLWNGEWRLVA